MRQKDKTIHDNLQAHKNLHPPHDTQRPPLAAMAVCLARASAHTYTTQSFSESSSFSHGERNVNFWVKKSLGF